VRPHRQSGASLPAKLDRNHPRQFSRSPFGFIGRIDAPFCHVARQEEQPGKRALVAAFKAESPPIDRIVII